MSMQSVIPLQTASPEAAPPQTAAHLCPQFQVIYLNDDAGHSVKVVETPVLQLQELLQYLLSGGSVFISCKP